MRRVLSRVLLLGAVLGASGCENLATGPSLSDVVISLDGSGKSPTITGSPNLCCCHVAGKATNRTTVPLYITIAFKSFGLDDKEISTILYFMPDVSPGATQPIDAPGFIVPCDAIKRFTFEVKVRGLTDPPL